MKEVIYKGEYNFAMGLSNGDILEYVKSCGDGCIAKDKFGRTRVLMVDEFEIVEEED